MFKGLSKLTIAALWFINTQLNLIAPVLAAEQNDGQLGSISTGHIRLEFVIDENVVAGFLQTNLDNPRSEFRSFLSSQLIQRLRQNMTTTLPFCVISNGEAYYEIASYQNPNSNNNELRSEFGASLPFYVVLGESEESAVKYKAVADACDAASAIAVKIKLNKEFNGNEIGNIHGKLNLLVKSE
jgi:hypothetical protein